MAWGTLPSGLIDARVGDKVTFTGTFTPSDKDAKFAFFSRPASARVEEVAAV